MEGWRKENCVLYVCTAGLVLVLYAMSGSFHSFWGMSMLVFVNSLRQKS